jgi:hypothetical protein
MRAVAARRLRRDLVPHHHGVALRVRLGDHRQVPAGPRPGELEREAQDPFDACARHDRHVHRGLDRQPLVHAAADAGVFAFGVLAHDDPVEVFAAAGAQRALKPRQDAGRPHVRVLVEALADLQPQAPQRDVVGNVRVAGRAEEDRVLVAQRIQAIGRHHRAVCAEVVAAPVEMLELEAKAGGGVGQGLQHLLAGRHHFLADAVAGNGRDAVSVHAANCRRRHDDMIALEVNPSLTTLQQ